MPKTIFIGPRRTGTSSLHIAFGVAGLLKNIHSKENLKSDTSIEDSKIYISTCDEIYLFEPSIFGRHVLVEWLVAQGYKIVVINREQSQRYRSDLAYHLGKGMSGEVVMNHIAHQHPSEEISLSYHTQYPSIIFLDFNKIGNVDYLLSKLGVNLINVPHNNRSIWYPNIIKTVRPLYRKLPQRLRFYIKKNYEKIFN